jgi:hypothetical protein
LSSSRQCSVADKNTPVFSRTSSQHKVKSCRVADGFVAGKGEMLDLVNAEPQVFDRVFRRLIGTEAIAIHLELGLGDGTVHSM